MSEAEKQDILLETGTNEMEIIEFYVGDQPLGINVHKLKEIIPFDETAVTAVPGRHPSMLGTLLLRGATIPLVDLKAHLEKRHLEELTEEVRPVVLVCEFNHRTNGFMVDGVNQIHRVLWSDVQPLAPFIDQYRPCFTGSINIENREILILDLEHIIGEFDPDSVLREYSEEDSGAAQSSEKLAKRGEKKVLMAEDSSVIRSGIEKVLREVGFEGLEIFIDGAECYSRVLELKKQADDAGEDIGRYLNMVISDIEMPKMDGLTLCRKVKEGLGCNDLPVLLFSSLINPPMEIKCDSVGADGYASKPELTKLIKMMDNLLEIDS